MAKAENYFGKVVMPQKVVKRKSISKQKYKSVQIPIKSMMLCFMAFLMGQVNFFNALNPIGIAFVSACMGIGAVFYIVCISVFVGYIIGSKFFGAYGYGISIALLACLTFLLENKDIKLNEKIRAYCGGICLFIGGMFVAVLNEFSMFLMVRSVVEAIAVVAISIVFERGINIVKNDVKRKILTDDEALCLSVPIIFAISSLSGMSFFGFSPKMFFCIFFILSLAHTFGASVGGAVGCILGFVLIMCGQADNVFLCVISFAGIMCGFFGRQSKISALMAFAAASSVPAFYMGMEQDINAAVMSVLGATLFMIMPERVYGILNTYSSGRREFDENKYFIKVRQYTEQKINELSKAFEALSEIFGVGTETNDMITPKSSAKIIDSVADRVCSNCGLGVYCWKTKTLETYGAVYSMINDFEENDSIDTKKLPQNFARCCVKINQLAEAVNSCCREFKTAGIWKNRLDESRFIIKEQLKEITNIINETKDHIDFRANFDESAAKEIKTRLEKNGINIFDASVSTNEEGKVSVVIEGYGCGGNERCASLVGEISSAIGRTMVLSNKVCSGERCTSYFEEENVFGCSYVYSSVVCKNGEISGDSFEAKKFRDDVFTAAISDGMGTGKKASKQSSDVLEKFKKLILAGIDEEIAVKAVNCAMDGGIDETFATLDVLSINLKNGNGRIIKNGGSSVFIIRNGTVTSVKSTSLPLGISCKSQSEVTRFTVFDKDIVLMVTDGITDALRGENEEDVVLKVLRNSKDIKTLCNEIIKYATKKDGGEAKDDMLVAAVKIYES